MGQKMQVYITNLTSQPKIIPVSPGTKIPARRSIELEVTQEELILFQRTAGFSVQLKSSTDPTNQIVQGVIFGEKPSYTPKISVGHLKAKVEELETQVLSAQGHRQLGGVVLETRLSIIESKLNYALDALKDIHGKLASGTVVQPRQGGPSASEMLNMPDPQESRRSLFEKIVKQNQEIRR